MVRYRYVDLGLRRLPADLERQLVPDTFAYAVHDLIDDLDLSAFDAHGFCLVCTGGLIKAENSRSRRATLRRFSGLT